MKRGNCRQCVVQCMFAQGTNIFDGLDGLQVDLLDAAMEFCYDRVFESFLICLLFMYGWSIVVCNAKCNY